jgi:hypothetical protein
MTVEDAIRDFATAGHRLPRAAMCWALDNWDTAGPRFVEFLDRYADGIDRSEEAAAALFFVLHLLGEKAETRAFPGLCRLLRDAEVADLVLGDGITTTLRGILIGTFDGDAAALKSVVECLEADEYVREAALLAMAYLTRTGRVPDAEMRSYLSHLLAEMRPRAPHYAWVGWVLAVALLGYEDLAGEAEGLIRGGLVPGDVMRVSHFRQDLRRTLEDPERMAGFAHDRIGPFEDAIGELDRWHAFSEEGEASYPLPDLGTQQPVTNPLKGIGRNDPCPCGSGKKFKKCCLR